MSIALITGKAYADYVVVFIRVLILTLLSFTVIYYFI